MQKNYLIALLIALTSLATTGCEKVSSRQDLESIQAMEKQADKEREKLLGGEADTALIGELGRSYMTYADDYPQAPETPEFLFRAGELYSNDLGNMEKSITIFKRNYQNYPDHETAANALFLIGYIYHNVLLNLVQAEKYYKEFLEKYPDHKMSRTAEFELQHLGQSPEDVFNQFVGPDSTQKGSFPLDDGFK